MNAAENRQENMKIRSPLNNLPVFGVYRTSNLLSVPQPINKP